MGRGRLSQGAQGKLNVTFRRCGTRRGPPENQRGLEFLKFKRVSAKSSMTSVEPPSSGCYFRLERNASIPAL